MSVVSEQDNETAEQPAALSIRDENIAFLSSLASCSNHVWEKETLAGRRERDRNPPTANWGYLSLSMHVS